MKYSLQLECQECNWVTFHVVSLTMNSQRTTSLPKYHDLRFLGAKVDCSFIDHATDVMWGLYLAPGFRTLVPDCWSTLKEWARSVFCCCVLVVSPHSVVCLVRYHSVCMGENNWSSLAAVLPQGYTSSLVPRLSSRTTTSLGTRLVHINQCSLSSPPLPCGIRLAYCGLLANLVCEYGSLFLTVLF